MIPNGVLNCEGMFKDCTSLHSTVTNNTTRDFRTLSMLDGCPLMNNDGTPKELTGAYTLDSLEHDPDTLV